MPSFAYIGIGKASSFLFPGENLPVGVYLVCVDNGTFWGFDIFVDP